MEREFASNVDFSASNSGAAASVSSKSKNVSEQKPKHSSPSSFASGRSTAASKSKPFHNYHGKRQSNRGGNSTNTGNTEYGGAVASAELGSVSRPGSKKGNPVYEFGPFYDKRRGAGNYNGGRGHGGGGGYHRFDDHMPSRRGEQRNRNLSLCYAPSYNKEQYLQATCQFIVMEGFNYDAHISDADLVVDWDRIEELRLAVDEMPCCPICLYPPNAAKITRCGHVFCWPCILHYLALSDKAWRKCPICYESVYKNQLKSVATSTVTRFNVGGEITMTLMRREKGSNIVLPAPLESVSKKEIQQVDGANAPFAKLLLISRKQVAQKIVVRERAELLAKLVEDENEPEACFVREALEGLEEREKLLESEKSAPEKPPSTGSSPPAALFSPFSPRPPDVFVDAFNDEKRSGGSCSVRSAQSAPAAVSGRFSSPLNNASNDEFTEEASADCVETLGVAATALAVMNDKYYYFYQAHDGQQVYLHPLSARCLIHQYGTLSAAPATIIGMIAEIETFVMTEDLRRRYRYLSHLPLTTAFRLVELKLPTDILSLETVKTFSGHFAKREDARQRKAKEEKRQQTQAERWERAVMLDPRNFAKHTRSNMEPPEIPFTTFVPSAQRDIEAGFTSLASAGAEATDVMASNTAHASYPPLSSSAEQPSAMPSFAQKLREGKPKPPPKEPPRASNEPANQPSNELTQFDVEDLDEDQRSFLRSQASTDTIGDAIQMAFDCYRRAAGVTTTEGDDGQEATQNAVKKKTKKKAKGRVLLSMGTVAPGLH